MTPSILAPLGAAPAQPSGPDATDTTATSIAESDASTSFRDLVAQENSQSDARAADQEQPSGSADDRSSRPQGEGSKGPDEAQAARESEESDGSAQAATAGQGLPQAAASNGLAEMPSSLTQAPMQAPPPNTADLSATSTATVTGAPDAQGATTLANGGALAAATTTDDGRTAMASAAASTATATGLMDRNAVGGRTGAANGIGRDLSLTAARRTGDAVGPSGNLAAALGNARGREGVRLDGVRGADALGGTLGSFGAIGSAEGFSLNANAAAAAPATTAGAPTAPVPGAIPAALAPNPLQFSLEGTGTVSSNPTSFELTQPLGSQAWQQELGGRLHWMADARIGRAELRLNPPELGPVEITLNIRGEEVSASFQAQHAATREAVEQAMPRLREMLAQSGLQLADSSVGQQTGQQTAQDQQGGAGGDSGRSSITPQGPLDATVGTSSADLTLDALRAGPGPGRLDLYA